MGTSGNTPSDVVPGQKKRKSGKPGIHPRGDLLLKGNHLVYSSDDDEPPSRHSDYGDGQVGVNGSPAKTGKSIPRTFKTAAEMLMTINGCLQVEQSCTTTFGNLSTDLMFQREGTLVTRTLNLVAKFFPRIYETSLLANKLSDLIGEADPIDHTVYPSSFVYELLAHLYTSNEVRGMMYAHPSKRDMLNNEERLLPHLAVGVEEEYMQTLRNNRQAAMLRGTKKFLNVLPTPTAHEKKQPPGNPKSPNTNPFSPCPVCNYPHSGKPSECRSRCMKCTGAIPFKNRHTGPCN